MLKHNNNDDKIVVRERGNLYITLCSRQSTVVDLIATSFHNIPSKCTTRIASLWDSTPVGNKNRLCSKTCGIDDSMEKNQQDPTPK